MPVKGLAIQGRQMWVASVNATTLRRCIYCTSSAAPLDLKPAEMLSSRSCLAAVSGVCASTRRLSRPHDAYRSCAPRWLRLLGQCGGQDTRSGCEPSDRLQPMRAEEGLSELAVFDRRPTLSTRPEQFSLHISKGDNREFHPNLKRRTLNRRNHFKNRYFTIHNSFVVVVVVVVVIVPSENIFDNL